MAEKDKKYYWLKLKEGFFGDKEIKKLRKIAGGDTYTIIYLKLMLLSLRENGKLYYDGIEETFYEELALEIDEEPDNVRVTLLYLAKMGLMEEISNSEAFLTRIPESVGSETRQAEVMRKKRAREKTLKSGNNVTTMLPPVTKSYTEIDIDKKDKDKEKDIKIDIESEEDSPAPPPPPTPPKPKKEKPVKHKYGEYKHVLLSDEEIEKLKKDFGEYLTKEAIKFLDEYIEETGYKKQSHYLSIRRWVIDAVKEKDQKKAKAERSQNKSYDADAVERMILNQMNSPKTAAEDEIVRSKAEALKERLGQS